MKKTISRILSLFIASTLALSPLTAWASFNDVSSNYPYAKAINFLQENNIVSGYPDGSYQPSKAINRVEFLKIVLEASNVKLDATEPTGFTDVDENSWYGPYLKKASQEGWVTGYPDKTFQPGKTINKVEALKIVAEVQNWQLKALADIKDKPYNDIPDQAWYLPYVDFAKSKGIMTTTATNLDPGKFQNRGEVAELLYQTIIKGVSNFTIDTTPEDKTVDTTAPSNNNDTPNLNPVTFSTFNTNSFQNITLNETFPNIFYKNEIYTFNGQLTKSGYDQVLFFLSYDEKGETKYINFVGDVKSDKSFSVPVNFNKTGNFKVGLIPGTNGTSKVYDISILSSLPASTNAATEAKAPENVKITTASNKASISWTQDSNQLHKINVWQNNKIISYFTRQNTNSISLDFKDFANFQTGQTYYSVESAQASSTIPVKLASAWATSSTYDFTALQHQSSFIYPDDISIKSFKDYYGSPQKISISGTFESPAINEAAIIRPDGLIDRVTLSSSSPTSKYYSYTILPTNSSFTFQYTPKSSGIYIVEFNKQNGSASYNVPIYVGGGHPLIPDYFETNNDTLNTSKIDLAAARVEMLDYINDARQEHGFSTLELDDDLNILSQLHSEDMATNNFFSHINLQGESPSDRRKKLNIPTEVSENLGKAPSIRYGHEGLMRSAIHRENILDKDWSKVGLGFAKDKYGYIYITQEYSHEPYSESDLAKFQDGLLESINEKRSDFNLESVVKNETLDKISQALSSDLLEGVSITSNSLSNYFKEYNISNKAALVVSGNSPNNEKIISETTKGIDSNHSQWLEAGIDYALDEFGSIIFVILYTN